jgi:hypothetical protein
VVELIKAKLDLIKKQRYNYPALNLMFDLKNKFTFFDNKLAKEIINEEIDKVLGGKKRRRIKRRKIKKRLRRIKSKTKKRKKKFLRRRQKKIATNKRRIKKIRRENKKIKRRIQTRRRGRNRNR